MNRILELREKRAKAWDAAKKFLDAKTGPDGLVSAEDSATYDKMEADVLALGKEVERLERQAAIDAALNAPANQPITEKPGEKEKAKAGRASAEYAAAFWQAIRSKSVPHEIFNALETGTDSEGGYLVPDEYQRTLIDALQEQNIFRQLAHVITTTSGERKIPVVASHGTAAWIDEEGSYPESDDAFGQVSIGSYKLATMIKVSEELLNDSAFDVPAYIAREFARRIGAAEEEAFFTGNGTGKPLGILAARHQGGVIDRVLTVLNQITMSIPGFLVGIALTYIFGLVLKWFTPGAYAPPSQGVGQYLWYLFFPAMAVALPKAAMTVKMLRGSVLSEMGADYIRTAYSKGNTMTSALWRHVLRNAMIPVVTFLAMTMADIVAGSIVVEQVFAIPGLGQMLISSIGNRDYPVVQAVVVIIASVVVLCNFAADLLYRVMDPRLRGR